MRWEALFADLEAQLDAAATEELNAEVADRTRRELARLHLVDRARAAVGATVTVAAGAVTVSGTLTRVGPDWWLLREQTALEALIPLTAVGWVAGLPAAVVDPESVGAVESRLGLAHALRGVARDRAPVTLVLTDGRALTGTIDGVGADFVDVSEHAPGEARRPAQVRGARTVPFAAVAVVRVA